MFYLGYIFEIMPWLFITTTHIDKIIYYSREKYDLENHLEFRQNAITLISEPYASNATSQTFKQFEIWFDVINIFVWFLQIYTFHAWICTKVQNNSFATLANFKKSFEKIRVYLVFDDILNVLGQIS